MFCKRRCRPSAESDNGTSLHLAVKDGKNVDVLRLLLRHHANVAAQLKDKKTVLHLAILVGRADILVELLFNIKANKSRRGKIGFYGPTLCFADASTRPS